jgi:PAS domain S-box-containing protein
MTDKRDGTDAAAEEARLSTLSAHHPAGLEDDPCLTEITSFAAGLCGSTISLVSLVERDRQWFPARCGIDARETPRETSFCAYAMTGDTLMVVPDARKDPRFCDNPLVTGPPHIRFYAGAPLVSADGIPLGALCIIDPAPREGLTDLQHQGLTVLAASVARILAARRQSIDATRQFGEQEQKFAVLADTMPQMVWSTLPDGYHDYYNARWYEFTGMPAGSTDGERWNGMFHPEDQDRAWAIWRRSLETGEPYEIEYRLRSASGEYRWTLGRALPVRNEQGEIVRWFGTCTDIHDSKIAQQQRELLTNELSHRIKNIFTVISGLIGFSTRHHPEIKHAADDLRQRIAALGRAHDFVRPHGAPSEQDKRQSSLHGMLGELMLPYHSRGDTRVRVEGEDTRIDDLSATPLALLFHELATNASKYGALSVPDGEVRIITSRTGDNVDIRWAETGGPAPKPPTTEGFGSKLIELSGVRQLGAKLEREWAETGLILTLRLPATAMCRSSQD